MGLFRLIIILAIIYLGYRLYLSWQKSKKKPKPEPPKQVENMVRCHHCDLHIPETDAIEHDGQYYCSQKHLQREQDK